MTRLHRRDLRPGAVRRARRRRTTRPSSCQRQRRTATAPPSSPATAARPGASSTRSRPAWSASTCRSRCRWPTTRFGGWKDSLFGDTHVHGDRGRALLHPRQGRHVPLARPEPRRREPRLPDQQVVPGSRSTGPRETVPARSGPRATRSPRDPVPADRARAFPPSTVHRPCLLFPVLPLGGCVSPGARSRRTRSRRAGTPSARRWGAPRKAGRLRAGWQRRREGTS